MRRPCLALVIALALGAAPASAADRALLRAADDAEEALERMDEGAFKAALARVRAELKGASAPLSPAEAAAVHELEGISASLAFNERAALGSLQAWRYLDAGATLSEEIAFEGSDLARQFQTVGPLGDGRRAAVVVPPTARLLIDGLPSSTVPAERAAVIQVVGMDGVVRYSGYYRGGEALPAESGLRWPLLDLAPGPPAEGQTPQIAQAADGPAIGRTDPAFQPEPSEGSGGEAGVPGHEVKRPRVLLLAGGGVALLGAAGLAALSASSQERFQTPGMAEDDLLTLGRLYRRNHAEVVGAAALGAAALGLGVGAFLEVSW